jgi:phage tail protein X
MAPGTALRVVALAVDEHNANHVVAATAYGIGSQLAPGAIYDSTSAGRIWTWLANTNGVVGSLTFNQGMVYAASAAGLARYGKPIQTGSAVALPDLRPLANPTGAQVLILVLAIALGGLALLGRPGWVLGGRATAA